LIIGINDPLNCETAPVNAFVTAGVTVQTVPLVTAVIFTNAGPSTPVVPPPKGIINVLPISALVKAAPVIVTVEPVQEIVPANSV
jgi:hypothetical protein